jgi:glycerol-3-phosphate cytidylyltransferase
MKISTIGRVFQTAGEVRDAIAPLRSQGKTLVSTNGCFDIVHAGHVQYLREAATLGDILVVGVNCDEVVRKLKGQGRPLQTEQDRLSVVASLAMVDAAFIFREDDPRAFLEMLRPDIHVKGGDYIANVVEKSVVEKYGGEIRIVSFLQGRSTTSLVRQIRAQGGGAGAM